MELWQKLMAEGVNRLEDLARRVGLDSAKLRTVVEQFPLRINAYYLGLIQEPGDPIWLQVIPDERELEQDGYEDPLNEEGDSPVVNLTKRYPDRVLFYVTSQCPIFCRFCTRKRKVGDAGSVSTATIRAGIEQIKKDETIRDIVISGGDPLMMQDEQLEWILKELRAIPHVEILRIGSRVPAVLPQRITSKLCEILKKYHPLYINVHFNHPREITTESSLACHLLADAGIPLGNQSVLLKGVNDDPVIMKELVQGLLKIRVRPYYIYQADLTNGTGYFRTSIQKGLEIIQSLRGHTSGLAVPHYVIDAPGGGGKIPIFPETIVSMDDEKIVLRNYEGKLFEYPTAPEIPLTSLTSCQITR